MKKQDSFVHYIADSEDSAAFRLQMTTVGYQTIAPYESYPPKGKHPDGYFFQKGYGRVLPEFQLVFISEGGGTFHSEHCPEMQIFPPAFLMLFPGERHYYEPLRNVGWTEYWVGFRGEDMENAIQQLPVSREVPVIPTSFNQEILSLFNQLIEVSEHELQGFQYLCNGIIANLLGYVAYSMTSRKNPNKITLSIIDKARTLMRTYATKNVSPADIAAELGVGYSWFRQRFRDAVGVSPNQYMQQQRMMRAEFLLSDPGHSVADIAYELGFANANQFSTFFKQHKHLSPLTYRKQLTMQ